MKISLLSDAPKHNLALMKISAWHKADGDKVTLNMPLFKADYTYASVLYGRNTKRFIADEYGGPAFDNSCLSGDVERMQPDYSLYPLDFSIGYTFRPCFNSCGICKVPKMNHPDVRHHSIFEFHNPKFKKICLLNNNTFQDQQWKETFREIWHADLSVIDENGYDIRLLDDEKADALHRTKWATPLHFAWDRMVDEPLVIEGLNLISNGVYVLIGYDTTPEEDLHRCQIINNYGLTPYPMPYIKNSYTKRFKRFINLHFYRQYKTIEKAWREYS